MGAGCYYTHECNGSKAPFILFPLEDCDEQCEINHIAECEIDDIYQIIYESGYYHSSDNGGRDTIKTLENSMYLVHLDSNYNGDGIIIRLEARDVEDIGNLHFLAIHNHWKSENKIIRELQKNGYKLYKASSGYTYEELNKV